MRIQANYSTWMRGLGLCVAVGLALFGSLPLAEPSSTVAQAGGVQAFSDAAAPADDLDRDAIVVHALIEYVFAPQRTVEARVESVAVPTSAAGTPDRVAVAAATTPSATDQSTATAPPIAIPTPTQTASPAAPPPPTPTPPPPALVASDPVSRGQLALARMPISPSAVGFTIEFLPGRSGYGGLTYPDSRRIEIYVDASWSDGYLAHVVAHEIGHAVDMARNSRSDHNRWRAARGIPAETKWWADPYTSDFATPGGDFAECFAAWAVGTSATRSQFGSCAGTGSLMGELVWG